MKRTLIRLVIFVLIVSLVPVFADTTVDLGYQLENGMVFKYGLAIDTQTSQVVKNQTIKRNEKIKINYTFRVIGEKESRNTPVQVTIDFIHYELDGLFLQYAGDLKSENKELPNAVQPYAAFVGANFIMDFSNRATIRPGSVTMKADPEEDEDGDDSDDEDNESAKLLAKLLAGTNTENISTQPIFPDITKNIFMTYPSSKRPLKFGSSWKQTETFGNGSVTPGMKVTYTIREIGANSFQVSARAKALLKYKRTHQFMQQWKQELKTKLTGAMEETVTIDKKSGLPVTGNASITMSGMVTRLGSQIPTTLQISIQFEQLK